MGNDTSYHEPYELLSEETRDMHRALRSMQEELEAIDWYQQRAEACHDEELRDILLHNRRDEMEHAAMALGWLRRRSRDFAEQVSRFVAPEEPGGDPPRAADDPAGRDGSLGLGALEQGGS